jgi:predicted MFS family arabinose efflux permease
MADIPVSAIALLFAFCASVWMTVAPDMPSNQILLLTCVTAACGLALLGHAVNFYLKFSRRKRG